MSSSGRRSGDAKHLLRARSARPGSRERTARLEARLTEDALGTLDIDAAEIRPDLWRVTSVGELARGSSETLPESLLELVVRGASRIVVDLSGVTFIDSSGVNALVLAHDAVSAAGASVVYAAPSEQTSRLFHLLRLTDVVTVEESVDDALERVSAANDGLG